MPSRRHVLHIDSGFRDKVAHANANQYNVLFGEPYRNVASIRLLNLQLPVNYARFHSNYNNTTFKILVGTTQYSLSMANGALATLETFLLGIASALGALKTGNTAVFKGNWTRIQADALLPCAVHYTPVSADSAITSITLFSDASASTTNPFYIQMGITAPISVTKDVLNTMDFYFTNPFTVPYNKLVLELEDINQQDENVAGRARTNHKSCFAMVYIPSEGPAMATFQPIDLEHNVSTFPQTLSTLSNLKIRWRFDDGIQPIWPTGAEHSLSLEIVTV